jgi:Uma2 family endonuclease
MSKPELISRADAPAGPLKRVEYERLAAAGCFEGQKVELLFGVVVPMTPIDPPHSESTEVLRETLRRKLGDRARVRGQNPFAASDISEPEPDVSVVPNRDYWTEHPAKAFLVVEVARSSLLRDRGQKLALYATADVDEYWIVNHVDGVIEVYRDRHAGAWRSRTMHYRGDTIAMLAFPDVEVAVSEVLPPARR